MWLEKINQSEKQYPNNTDLKLGSSLTKTTLGSEIKDAILEKEILPIDEKKNDILNKLSNTDELIVVAETWAWKTTRVPQFLYEAGYDVVVTQPRALAAMSLADRIAKEMWVSVWSQVWYRVGWWWKFKNFNNQTRLLLATDALQNIYPLIINKMKSGQKLILVIDEIHEWNKNIEVLLAWIRLLKKSNSNSLKVVYMSATIDADSLLRYLETTWEQTKKPQKVEVWWRLFPVLKNKAWSKELINVASKLYQEWKNILIFQPGKREIENCIKSLQWLGLNANIYQLHSEVDKEEQQKIFDAQNKQTIVVSTNIAQTSVTINYIDAVIDTWVERRVELKHGVETVVLWNISKADLKQRAWRAWRCKPWTYYLCHDWLDEEFPSYSLPEIQRTRVDLNYLKVLWITWLKLEELDFFHAIKNSSIIDAKDTLRTVEAITAGWEITEKWKQLSTLSVDVMTWAMILEAAKLGCLDSILKIAAIKQSWWIIEFRSELKWWQDTVKVGNIPNEFIDSGSDLITQMNLFSYVFDRKIQDKFQLVKSGINPKSYRSAKDLYLQFQRDLQFLSQNQNNKQSCFSRNNIIQAITAGMWKHVWRRTNDWTYVNKHYDYRSIDKNSVVKNTQYIVGTPKTIEFDKWGKKVKMLLLTEITEITKELFDIYNKK